MTQKLVLVLFFTGFLFPFHTFSQESDTTLAMKYFNLAEYFSSAKFPIKDPKIKADSTYTYMKLALPLLKKAELWQEYINAAKEIGVYDFHSGNEDAIRFLVEIVDTLKKNKIKDYTRIYLRLASMVQEKSPNLFIKYLGYVVNESSNLDLKVSALISLGSFYSKQKNYEKALSFFNQNLDYAKQRNKAIPAAYKHISSIYKILGQYNLALKYLDSAIIVTENNPLARSVFINDKGAIYSTLGNFEKALEYCVQAVKIQVSSKIWNFHILSREYSNIASMLYVQGDFLKSNEYVDQAISLLQNKDPNSKELLIPYQLKVLNSIELGMYTSAFKYSNSYKNLLKTHNHDTSYVFNLYGKIYYNLEKYDSSLIFFQLSENAGVGRNELNYIGEIFFKLKEYEKSRLYYSKFINRITSDSAKSKHPIVINANKFIADTYYNEGKYDSALIYYNHVLQLAGINNYSFHESEALNKVLERDLTFIIFDTFRSISDTYNKINSNNDAPESMLKSHSYLLTASELLNNYKYYFESINTKLFWTEKTAYFYDDAIRCSIRLWNKFQNKKYLDDAFRLIEQSKVHVLKGSINESSAIGMSDIPDSLIAIENNYSKRLSSLRFSRRNELQKEVPDNVKLDYFDNEIFNIKRDYSFLIKNFEKNYPAYHRIKYESNTIDLRSLKEKLNPDQSVLQYYLGKNEIHLIIIDKDSAYSISAKADSNFFDEIASFTSLLRKGNLLRNKQKSEFISTSNSLYKKLLLPAAEYLRGKKELIIIPSGELLSVPFELLIKEPSSDLSFTKLQYTLKDFIISYEYSATLGFDPKYKNQTPGSDCFIGFAPSFKNNRSSNPNQRLPELLYNEEEVNQIFKLFRSNNREAVIYSGDKATEDNFKKNKNCRYIHIATHSEADKDNPGLSALYFSGPLADTLSDNILYSDEIFDLKLSADLVVLSSCETGAGRLIHGEGVLSLTRGFIYNGVPNLLFSLWKVSDRSTKSLMVEFYKNVIEGKDYKTALRDSKLKMLSNEVTSFPDKWGAFILMSN